MNMKKITVIGLGASEIEQLPLGAYRHLKKQGQVYIRTMDHPVAKQLSEEGIQFLSFDSIYEKYDDFESVYEAIVAELVSAEGETITYAVPGHPFVAEKTVQLLLEAEKQHKIELDFLGGHSFLDEMYTALRIDPIEGCQIVDGLGLTSDELNFKEHIIIVQVYDRVVASDVKLALMERLPDDYEVTIATAVGSSAEKLTSVPLYELDRVTTLNNLTAVYIPPVKDETLLYGDFSKLKEVIATLRGPDGCPWDQKQTHESLKKYLLEEAYEVLEAIDEEDDDHLIEELGDVLLQVMLHAQIGADDGYFSVHDVIKTITEKMIRRHPHVFGQAQVQGTDEVLTNWEQIKAKEKGVTDDLSIFSSIPKGLPALMEAMKLQKKAAGVGFDWEDAAPIWMKLQEEMAEFMMEMKEENREKMKREFGDILFVLVNLARYYGIDAEEALLMTNQKFKRRFKYIEETSNVEGKNVKTMSLEELDRKWEEAKRFE